MAKVERKEPEEAGAPLWMLTYGDMVTLVLTFFILLFTFSTIDIQRFEEVMSAIRSSLMGGAGVLQGGPNLSGSTGAGMDSYDVNMEDLVLSMGENDIAVLDMMAELEQTYDQVKSFLTDVGLQDDVQLRLEDRGIVLELPERILFDSGMAVIKTDFLPVIDLLAVLLEGLPNQIIIEGHTDNVPINTYIYPSNWELSVARAVSVARYLVETRNLPPGKFVATGYGEYHPLDTNETSEGRARNRRVSVVISIVKYNAAEVIENGQEGTGEPEPGREGE